MGIRPAKTIREWKGPAWSRTSKRKPRKCFVKGAPHSKVRQYNMGTDKRFDLEVELCPTANVQLRDNAIEAARQAANKYLEKTLVDNFFLQVVAFPHLVIREHSALGVAGADRISKGMKKNFGKPKGRMARVRAGHAVLRARINKAQLPVLKAAFKRARLKMSGAFQLVIRDITNDAANLSRSVIGRKMKKREEVKPVVEAAAAAPAVEAAKEGEAAGEAAAKGAPVKGAPAKAEAKEGKSAARKK